MKVKKILNDYNSDNSIITQRLFQFITKAIKQIFEIKLAENFSHLI